MRIEMFAQRVSRRSRGIYCTVVLGRNGKYMIHVLGEIKH